MSIEVLSKLFLMVSLGTIMLTIGMSLSLSQFKPIATHPKAFAVGMVSQMLVLPLLGYGIVTVFALPPELAAGFIILCLAPGGVTSNAFTYLSGGNVALSVTLTVVCSLIAPITLPLAAAFILSFNETIQLSYGQVVSSLLIITLIPLSLGMAFKKWLPKVTARIHKGLNILSLVLLALVIVAILAQQIPAIVDVFSQLIGATLSLCVLAFLSGYVIAKAAKLKHQDALAIGNEAGMQNGTTALFVTSTLLASPTMSLPVIFYSVLMFGFAALFSLVFRYKDRQSQGEMA